MAVPQAFLMLVLDVTCHDGPMVSGVTILSDSSPAIESGRRFAVLLEGFGRTYIEGKKDILARLKADSVIYQWLKLVPGYDKMVAEPKPPVIVETHCNCCRCRDMRGDR